MAMPDRSRDDAPIRISRRFEGPVGSGQGGWTAAQFAERIDAPLTIALRAAIPFDTDMTIVDDGPDRWRLATADDTTIMIGERWEGDFPETEAVSIDEAAAARVVFGVDPDDHPAPVCFSCGGQADSMQVHPGPLADGRFATDWTVPDWTRRDDGSVEPGAIWAAIDCTAAWFTTQTGERRVALTAQFTAEIVEPITAGETYALVGWAGGHDAVWDGRKRRAASAAFDREGRCVARSTSLWISVA